MTIIGAILLLISVLLLLGAIFGGSDGEVQLDLGLVEISMSVLSVFLVGAASVLLFVCGLELLRSGTRRSLRRRRELKHARAVVAQHEKREGPADPHPGETRRDAVGTATGEGQTTTDPATESAPPKDTTRRTEPGSTTGSDRDSGPAPDTRDPGRQ